MAFLSQYRTLYRDFHGVADFVLVYIEEAHPIDGWKLRGNPFSIKAHKTLDDRISAAKLLLQSDIPSRVLIDRMDDAANLQYGAWPERLYIVKNGKIVAANRGGSHSYSMDEIRNWLEEFSNREKLH